MKPLLTNRMVQWMLLFVFCSCVAYGANTLLPSQTELKAALSESAATQQPMSNDAIPYDTPPTDDQGITAPLSDRIVEYHIAVKLQPELKTLQAAQVMTWENPGAKPVKELYLHLYPNAFES